MIKPVCLKLKDTENEYVCNQKYITQSRELIPAGRYETISDDLIQTLEDLIRYCLTYNYDIEIPERYKVEHLYHIVYSIGDFEPKERERTSVRSSITFTTRSKSQAKKMFERMCEIIGKKPVYKDKRTYCWQGEDFAVNQIVQSYSITESYLVEEVNKTNYKEEILKLVKDIKGFCRNDVLYDLVDKIERLYNEKE